MKPALSDAPVLRRSVLGTARDAVVVVVEDRREVLVISGGDARSWLNGLVTCELTSVGSALGAYGLLLNKQGKIQTDLDIVAGNGRLIVGTAPGLASSIREALDRYLVMEDVELALEPELAWLRLHGPKSDELRAWLAEQDDRIVASGRIDWLGLGGAALVAPRTALLSLAERAVARAGPEGLCATAEEWDFLRISRSLPAFAQDYTNEDNPHQASLDRLAVSFTKGCYLGQEVVCMQDMRGKVKRRLVSLRLGSESQAAVGAEVVLSSTQESVGHVTSLARSDAGVVAMARLRAPYFDVSSELRVAGVPAEVVARPDGE